MDRESWVVSSHDIPCLGNKQGIERTKAILTCQWLQQNQAGFVRRLQSPVCTGIPPQVCAHCSFLGHFLGNASICLAFIPRLFPWEGRSRVRSPVVFLLTTPPDELAAGSAASPEHSPAPGKVGSPEGAATAPQRGMSSPMSWSGHLHPLPVLFKQKVYSVINELSVKHSS